MIEKANRYFDQNPKADRQTLIKAFVKIGTSKAQASNLVYYFQNWDARHKPAKKAAPKAKKKAPAAQQ